MKSLVTLIVCIAAFIHCKAQAEHIPDPKAKALNDKAVGKYLKYNSNPDSVLAAVRLLDKAVEIDSFYYNAWTNKLGYECQLRRFEEAMNTTGNITRIFPKSNDILFFRGILQFKFRHDREAIATFEKLVKIYDKEPNKNYSNDDLKTDLINKAIALKLIGKTDEGNEILRKLADKEHDPAVKKYIMSYISDSKETIINNMVP